MTARHLACCLLLASVLPARAGAVDGVVQLGASDSRRVDRTGTVWAQAVFDPHQWRRVELEPVASAGWIAGRNEPGYEEDVGLAGGGGRMRWIHPNGAPSRFFLEGQLLGALGRTQAISGPIQFATAAGWSRGTWEIVLRHVSNGGLEGSNRGETMLLVGRKF